MSKKSLLEEGTVRRFMKLAGTQVLASDFLTETTKGEEDETSGKARGSKKGDEAFINEEADDEETPLQEQDELDIEAEEEDFGGEEIEDMEMDLEEPGADLEVDDVEVEEAPEAEPEELVRDMVDAIAGVAREYGVDVEVGEEETPELEVPEMGPGEEEEEEEITGEFGPEGADVEEEEEITELDEINYIDENLVLNEVFHRVKKRLVQEKRVDEMYTRLAKRISKRLNKRSRR